MLLVIVLIKGIATLILGAAVYFFVLPIFSGAPYAPTKNRRVEEMLGPLGQGRGKRAADLGSGDGRIVIALAQRGFEAHGFELNFLLVLYSRFKIRRAGLQGRAFIHRQNYWKEDLSGFDVITVFGINYIMSALEKKLRKELKEGARVISNKFTFPEWKPQQYTGGVAVYIR